MALPSYRPDKNNWEGWSTISPQPNPSFTLWFTGLPATGKTTLANLLKEALQQRGYIVEIINHQTLSNWLREELHIDEDFNEADYEALSYDLFVTYICTFFAQHGIVSIATSVSPFSDTRAYARGQIKNFYEVHLLCDNLQRLQRLRSREQHILNHSPYYQPPKKTDLRLDTSEEMPEQSALHILTHLERAGFIAPLWDDELEEEGEGMDAVKTRLYALGYLE